jgi:hypothetical protein
MRLSFTAIIRLLQGLVTAQNIMTTLPTYLTKLQHMIHVYAIMMN